MGGKHKRKQKQQRQRQKQLPPLDIATKECLYTEAIEAISVLKLSKELFQAKVVKVGFILSRQWFDNWKTQVGYDQVQKGDIPSGRKYGRMQLGEMNLDLLGNELDYHPTPSEAYSLLDPPMRDSLSPVKDFIIIIEEAWKYFHSKYGGVQITRVTNEQSEFDLKMMAPYVVFMYPQKVEEIQDINGGQLLNRKEVLGFKKLQVLSSWNYDKLHNYLSEYTESEQFNVWLIDQTIDYAQMQASLLKCIHNGTYTIRAQLIDADQIKTFTLSQCLKSSNVLLIEQISKEYAFTKLEYQYELKTAGVCFQCNIKSNLNQQCACRKAFYCSDECRYRDQEFHQNICSKAYDSEDDEEMDQIKQFTGNGVGLVNMGNTCYMNSCLQSLFSSPKLQQYLVDKSYWNNGMHKKSIQLTYKMEKLMKQLLCSDCPVKPYGFRQQLSKVCPAFGTNLQQDAAEFLLYFFDAINEELTNVKNITPDKQPDVVDIDQPTQQQEDNSDSESGSDDPKDDETPQNSQTTTTFMQYKQKKNMMNQNDDANQTWEELMKNTSKLLIDNFIGMMQSQVNCPICQHTTTTFESFNILPLSLDGGKQILQLDVYVVFADWYTPYCKQTIKYDPTKTMLSDVKREVGELVGINPMVLMAAMTDAHSLQAYLFYDEDTMEKILKEYSQNYLCLFEMPTELHLVTDDDQYFDVQLFASEKKSQYSISPENIPMTIPKLMLISKNETLTVIYQKIFAKLGDHANADQLIQLIPQEPEQNDNQQDIDILAIGEIEQSLKYRISIETKIPAKHNCPFSCGRYFKKEIKQHSCGLPFNNVKTLKHYLDSINYTNSHTSFIIEYQENMAPQQIRQDFGQLSNRSSKDKVQTLQELLTLFSQPEALLDENAYYCMTCQDLTFANKSLSLHTLPNQLVIQLKRFHFNEIKATFSKNSTLVEYPEQMKINDTQYSLYGVVLHFGGLENGHYVAYGKRFGQWYEFNDNKVQQMNVVLNDKNAYILFYQRQ